MDSDEVPLIENEVNGERNITVNPISHKQNKQQGNNTTGNPEIRTFMGLGKLIGGVDTANDITTVTMLGTKLMSGKGNEALKDIMNITFGGEPPPGITCDSYYRDRAKLAEKFLQSTQGSKGSYLVYDPTSDYYKTIMYGPLLGKLAPVPPETMYAVNPYSSSDLLSSEAAKDHCKTTVESQSPVMERLTEMLVDAPFMPEKAQTAYAKAKEAGNSKLGSDILKLIGRGIKVLVSLNVTKPSSDQLHSMVEKNLNRLHQIIKNKPPKNERKFDFAGGSLYIFSFHFAFSYWR